MQTHSLTLNGQDFFVRSWGQPHLPKLIMLHGFPEYSGAFDDLAPKLSGMFHCIAPDQRGYGQSWAPSEVGEYTTSKLVSDIVSLINSDLVGDGPVAVMGHDWGAGVAYALAMFHPELVSRLIIANGVHPAPFQREMARGGAQSEASQYINFIKTDTSHDLLAANECAKLIKLFSANMDTSWLAGERLDAYKTEWLRPGRLQGMTNWYRASPLKVADPGKPLSDPPKLPLDKMRIHCDHLLIWGMKDTAVLPESTEGLEDFCEKLTRVEIANADHWVLHQQPNEVAEAIVGWVIGDDLYIP
ncbi:MAG: pimeloyl-ACP methyl ester carboxylesterase [Candidatus Azotimanducaceae bacterium]|jgi:pimeloyl-ACP methyl ester carboxylesterase